MNFLLYFDIDGNQTRHSVAKYGCLLATKISLKRYSIGNLITEIPLQLNGRTFWMSPVCWVWKEHLKVAVLFVHTLKIIYSKGKLESVSLCLAVSF